VILFFYLNLLMNRKDFWNDIIIENEETDKGHLSLDFFYNYLFYLEKNSKKGKVCSNFNLSKGVSFEILQDSFIINIRQKKPIYCIDEKYKKKIIDFLNTDKCNIIICPILINFTFNSKSTFHINVVIINKRNKTIQHFEPHGNSFIIDQENIHTNIPNLIKKLLKSIFDINLLTEPLKTIKEFNINSDYNDYYEFIEHDIPCGLQLKVSEFRNIGEGYCVGWVLLIIHCYLYNKGNVNYIVDYLLKNNNPKQLNNIIKKYVNMVYKHQKNTNLEIKKNNCQEYKYI